MTSLVPTNEAQQSRNSSFLRRVCLPALALLLLATLSSCGGDDSTTAPADSAAVADTAQVEATGTQPSTSEPAAEQPVAEQPASPAVPTEAPAQESTQPVAASEAEIKTVIEYKRVGGIAGFDDLLIVSSDGSATLSRRGKEKSAAVDPASIQRLQQALSDANFATLDSEYLPTRQGNDYMEHTLTSAEHTVHAVDTAIPESLQPVLAVLTEIIKQVQ